MDVWIRLEMVGSQIDLFIWDRHSYAAETDRETRMRVASELQNRISETKFAWGEMRPYSEQPAFRADLGT